MGNDLGKEGCEMSLPSITADIGRQDDVMWISVCDINKDGPFQGNSVSDYCQA